MALLPLLYDPCCMVPPQANLTFWLVPPTCPPLNYSSCVESFLGHRYLLRAIICRHCGLSYEQYRQGLCVKKVKDKRFCKPKLTIQILTTTKTLLTDFLDYPQSCLDLVHWEDLEGSGGEVGGRGDRDGEHM